MKELATPSSLIDLTGDAVHCINSVEHYPFYFCEANFPARLAFLPYRERAISPINLWETFRDA
jgi:hypothetical protein